jgi:ankyrin repeat protein
MRRSVVLLLALTLAACTVRRDELTPLVNAARSGDVQTIRLICAHGADPDQPSGGNDWTPLLHAVHKNQAASVAALLDAGANVNRATSSGMTPVMLAAGYGQRDVVQLLLARGANPTLRDGHGETAIDYALYGVTDLDDFTFFRCQPETAVLLEPVSPPASAGAQRWSHLKRCT